MTKHEAGDVVWAQDPTSAHDDRPVIVLSHKNRPENYHECTVMCAGHGSKQYNHQTPELTDKHLSGISFGKSTYLLPWAMYTIPPAAILDGRPHGELTDAGKKLVKMEFIRLFG